MNFNDARIELRRQILTNAPLMDAISEFRGRNAAFFPGHGNLGDGLIQVGTFDLWRHLEWYPRVISDLEPESLDGLSDLVLGGGGGWIEGLYQFYPKLVTPFLQRGGRLLVLPSSFDGYEGFFRRFADQVTIFAREDESLNRLEALPELKGRVFSAHDMSFAMDPDRFAEDASRPGSGELNLFRMDDEAAVTNPPSNSIDLALVFNGIGWDSVDNAMPPLAAAAALISQFQRVKTDRLHMGVLAAMLGREVEMYAGSYHKIMGVFDRSLHLFDGVSFAVEVESADRRDRPSAEDRVVNRLRREIGALTRDLQFSRLRITALAKQLDDTRVRTDQLLIERERLLATQAPVAAKMKREFKRVVRQVCSVATFQHVRQWQKARRLRRSRRRANGSKG